MTRRSTCDVSASFTTSSWSLMLTVPSLLTLWAGTKVVNRALYPLNTIFEVSKQQSIDQNNFTPSNFNLYFWCILRW